MSNPGMISVFKTYKEGRVVTKEEELQEEIETPLIDKAAQASVKYDNRIVISLGNYETCTISVGITLPCYVSEVQEAFWAAKNFVEVNLGREVTAVKTSRDRKKS